MACLLWHFSPVVLSFLLILRPIYVIRRIEVLFGFPSFAGILVVWESWRQIHHLSFSTPQALQVKRNISQCHAEGGATKGGRKQMRANASKRRQTQTNADKRRGENAEAKTQANASKRGQTQTNAYTPLCCGFLTPLCNSLNIKC